MTGPRGSSNSTRVITTQICVQGARVFAHCRWSSNIAGKIAFIVSQPSTRTRSFWACAFLAGGAILSAYLVYRHRVRRIEVELTTLFHKRLSERANLAIDLNDSLLQTIEASKYIADNALDSSSDPSHTRSAMGRLSYWLGKAALEGQASLNSLRRISCDGDDLTSALLRVAGECSNTGLSHCSIRTAGISRDMKPRLRDEIYLLGSEIICALYKQDGKIRLEIVLKHGADFCLQVSAHGSHPHSNVIGAGQGDPFTFFKIQKRAQQLGATLSLTRPSHTTTVLTLLVPGNTTYTDATSLFPQWLLDLWHRVRSGRRNLP